MLDVLVWLLLALGVLWCVLLLFVMAGEFIPSERARLPAPRKRKENPRRNDHGRV